MDIKNMNKWKMIWNAYHSEASVGRILRDTITKANASDSFYLFVAIVGFITCFTIFIFGDGRNLFVFSFSAVFEVILIFLLFNLKKKLILEEYGDINSSEIPHDDTNHQKTRYFMFKSSLDKNKVTDSDIDGSIDLVDAQIDIAETNSSLKEKVFTFSSGLLLGVVAAIWKNSDMNVLILSALGIIVWSVLIFIILSLFTTKLEKLKELRYFMLLYKEEAKSK